MTKQYYQNAHQPVVSIPEKLIHHEVDPALNPVQGNATFTIVDLPALMLSMTVGLLQPAQKSGKHRHSYETLIYITQGEGYTMIEDTKVEWKAGDAIYIPAWTWHFNVNTGPDNVAKYVSCNNAPHLHALGLAMFEPAE